MKSVFCLFVRRVFGLASILCVSATLSFGAPPVLRWNGATGGLWDTATANWLDAGDNAVVWQPGAQARFGGSGGIVNIAADVSVSNLTFAANGYTLLGASRILVEGAVSAAAATTNSIGVDVLTAAGLSKTGLGAVSLARCIGRIAVAEGQLLASGSGFIDADVSVASGATLVTLGEPDATSNLIQNPGFELPVMTNGTWNYVSGGIVITNWTVTANPQFVGCQNTAIAGSPWNTAGASPEGVQMLIMQYAGAVAQTVTVPSDGLYSIAFTYLLRNAYPESQIYVALDGVPLASFLNRSAQFSPGRFASGALWLTAGSHTLGLSGEGGWSDRASMIDAVCFAAPSAANACRAFGGDSVLRAFAGASVVLAHAGSVTQAVVSIDGAVVSGTLNGSHASGIFSGTGSLTCAAPANVYTWKDAGLWSDSARWVDGAAPAAGGGSNWVMRFSSAAADGAATNDLAGNFLARRLAAFGRAPRLVGNAIALTNDASGTAPVLSLASPGAWSIEAPVTARSALTLDVLGDLAFTGNTLRLPNSSTLYKSGSGTVALPTLTNTVSTANVYEGVLRTPSLPSSLTVYLHSKTGKSAGLTLTQGGATLGNAIYLMGSGRPVVATACGGGTVTLSNWTYGRGDLALFDVAAGDTLSLRQLLLALLNSGVYRTTALTKAGPGTLEIRSGGADTGNNRAYFGSTLLQNGTLTLSEDDCGTLNAVVNPFNGRLYGGTGGSLGYSAFTNALRIGDSGTAASDALTLIANGDGRYVGRNIEIFNAGSTVTLGMTTGTVFFAGTTTLHRDITLSGPTNGVMIFSNIVAAADFSGTGMPTFSGLAGVRFEGAFPASASLVMGGRRLSFGTYAVKASALAALEIGSAGAPGSLDVDFSPGANDTIAVTQPGGLTLSNTVVNLYCAGTGLPFAEPGTYTLFTYAGSLGGDTAMLSVGNPQSGASYAFSNDIANARVLLVISNASAGKAAVWRRNDSGAWSLGSNWDSGTAPDAAGVTPLFGLAITTPSAVALETARTAGGLAFNNSFYGYTLSGGSLTLDNGATAPAITVSSGTHTLDTTLNSSAVLSVSAAANAVLVLGSNATVNAALTLATGLVRSLGTNTAVGTLSGSASSSLELSGTAPKVTVNQAAPGTFAGALLGGAGAQFVKDGGGTLTFSRPVHPFLGQTAVSSGTLSLQASALPAALSVGPAGTLGVLAAATNGLMGYYYSVTPNASSFATLAAQESHFATLTPDLASLSGFTSSSFDFGVGTTYNFPAPYNSSGSRPINFEAVWRGVITVPLSGLYTFGVTCDDGFLLAIDGQTVVNRTAYVAEQTDGTIRLDAGRYDIVLGYFQMTSGGGIKLAVRTPGSNGFITVPSSWLAPYSSSGTLTGSGSLTANASNALFRAVQSSGVATFGGDLSGPSGTLLAKTGNGVLSVGGSGATSNAFAGDLDVQGGTLALTGRERFGDASTLRVRTGASLVVAGVETAGALSGGGSVALGGSYVYTNAFTGNADSDISSAKTYTHALDFPAGSVSPVINGVTFTASGTSGSSGIYGWSVTAGTAPGSSWNTTQNGTNDTTVTGTDSFLWDFYYNSPDYTLTLTGLTPGQTYETRLYFRTFTLGATRNVTFTFSSGAFALGSVTHNIDALPRSWVGCRYVAGAAGSLSVRVYSVVAGTTCHLYGLSNERVAADVPALTVTAAAGKSDRFTGPITGGGSLMKAGPGTQRLSGAITLPTPLAVQAGKVTLDPGASVLSGAVVSAGATLAAPVGNVTLGSLSGSGVFDLTGAGTYATNTGPYFVTYTNDATTGISPEKTYTHLLDFGPLANPVAVINGVAFDKVTSANGPITGYGWTNFPTGTANNTPPTVPASSGIYKLLYDLNYNMATGVVRLTGLTIGKRYEVRLYNRVWSAGNRTQVFLFDPDGTGPISDAVTFNPDQSGSLPNFLGYRYTAGTNYLAITVQLTVATYAYHFYGLSNEEVYDSQLNPATLDIAGNSVFDGAVAGPGGWAKTGAGALTITGNSTNTGLLAVNAGAFGVAGNGRATAGPVTVAAGATLFGSGTVGGSVAVASNAWLQAGTAADCGTLQTGGSLTLAQGTRIAWRYASAASDTFTVNGLLTFPTSGVVQASALTAGVRAPAKATLFTSVQAISGPANLTGWTVSGVKNASLAFSDDRKLIYFRCPRGALITLK